MALGKYFFHHIYPKMLTYNKAGGIIKLTHYCMFANLPNCLHIVCEKPLQMKSKDS